MQGSNQGTKWTDNVVRLTRDHDIVALQEPAPARTWKTAVSSPPTSTAR